MKLLQNCGRIHGYEIIQFDMRAKSGAILRAEFSAEYIKLGDEDCMIAVIRDISEQKRMDEILHLRLKLWEFSISHNAVEVMQKALDEIESITGSQIGFYHLVEEDSNSLMLQVWSTRTSNRILPCGRQRYALFH